MRGSELLRIEPMFGRLARKKRSFEFRLYPRMSVEEPAVVSWNDREMPREGAARCLDISQGGVRLAFADPVSVSTLVRVRIPALFVEADGVVRHSSGGMLGVEFTRLVLLRPSLHRNLPSHGKTAGWSGYGLAALSFLLLGFILCTSPGLMPKWVPFATHASPPPPLESPFTLGSSRLEVFSAQGPPTRITESTWHYGPSRVVFRNDRVVGWSDSPGVPLRTAASSPERRSKGRASFTVGSTAAEVLEVQGPPTELTDDVWKYGSSEVYFQNGRVVRWEGTAEDPLKVSSAGRRGSPDLSKSPSP